jgi:methionine-rich copper-binding protein CopC
VTVKQKKIRGALLRLGPLLAISVIIPTLVWGHAFPDHSDPRVGSEVKAPPAQVKIWFDSGMEPLFSTLEVFDANKKKVDKGDGHVDPKDHTVLEVSLPPLPPGKYEVFWSVVSVDTHHTEGRFKFTIGGKS